MPGVYLSYPFCSQKCTFCNFASGVSPVADQRTYEGALLSELRRHRWQWTPETVYWGGGTPSLMPLPFLRELMSAIPLTETAEITLECAPGTVTAEKAQAWHDCGINRISLGVQSFVPDEARRTGRRHTPEQVEHEIALLADAGITDINIDLIAGLPGQTFDSWQHSLDWLVRLNPPHASVYLFEIDEDSNLGREALLGGIRYGAALLPSDETMASLYETAVSRLAAAGIPRYEISNFARPGFESRHNLKYWRLEPYIGFGLDAHSFDGEKRWSNTGVLAEYLNTPGHPPVETTGRTPSEAEEEHFFVGLRLSSGITPTAHEWQRFSQPIARSLESGLLQRDGETLRLTDRGILISNEIFQEFVHASCSL